MPVTTATAHPNIALIKYWGKQEAPGNLPATSNLSITLSELQTTTVVAPSTKDALWLNDECVEDAKVSKFLAAMRAEFDIAPVEIRSSNNFPTAAGLASSASGFAALVCALNGALGLGLNAIEMSGWARIGSASAARSMLGGYVELSGPDWTAKQIEPSEYWPLSVVVAVTSSTAKTTSSSEGMNLSRATSSFYAQWVDTAESDFAIAKQAIQQRDFGKLAHVAESNCLKMHSVMLTSTPTLAYWNPGTVACMQTIRDLRDAGTPTFFTIDAGPQLKAVCQPQDEERVAVALSATQGVEKVFRCQLGDGARVQPT